MTGSEAIDIFNSRYEFMASQNAPGFTDDEILELLNDSQYKFISQRAFGNNLYNKALEESVKRIDDLEKLMSEGIITSISSTNYPNIRNAQLPSDYLHFVDCYVTLDTSNLFNADLISQSDIRQLIRTTVNKPWIEEPFVYIKNGKIWAIFDDTDYTNINNIILTYIRIPDEITIGNITWFSDSSIREIIRIAIDEAIADGIPDKVQISNDQLNKTE